MTKDTPQSHPLALWLRVSTPEQREEAATRAGTSVNYLYQIAALRREPGVSKAFAIEDALRKMHDESRGRIAVVTAREIAQAWVLAGL